MCVSRRCSFLPRVAGALFVGRSASPITAPCNTGSSASLAAVPGDVIVVGSSSATASDNIPPFLLLSLVLFLAMSPVPLP